MFFESERIVNKQIRYANSRAYGIIQGLESKGLGDEEIVSCLNLLLKDEVSEFQKDILSRALKTVTLRQEQKSGIKKGSSTNSYSFIGGRVWPKILKSKNNI